MAACTANTPEEPKNESKLEFRALKADEIEVRVQSVAKSGKSCAILIYKDARIDQKLLDEVVGPLDWKREHELLADGSMMCTVSIWDRNKQQWVSKQDTGVESNTEALKGRASDSFKRACFNWGIGRELYSLSSLSNRISLSPADVSEFNGKLRLAYGVKFRVSEIKTEGDVIKGIKIVDQTGKLRLCSVLEQ